MGTATVWGYADNETNETSDVVGSYATRQEALDEARARLGRAGGFWILRGRRPSPADFVPDAARIVTWMADQACDEHSSEAVDGWPKLTTDALIELNRFLRSWAVKHAPVPFWTPDDVDSEWIESASTANERPEPVPLSAPDGRVFAYACSVCMNVGAAGEMIGVPESDEAAEEERQLLAEISRSSASGCCVCRDCGVTERGILGSCSACSAKRTEARHPAVQAHEQAHEQEEASEDV